ncbi:MAG: hypothetical protein PVF77_05520 [Anaerolineae bacterium]
MSETYSLGLSLLDFVPNLAFLVGAYYLVRLVRLTSSTLSLVLMIAGSFLVLLGGTTKALWKLLYTLGIGDYWLLGELQFMLLAPGFLAMLVSLVLVLRQERKRWETALVAMAPWKIPLLATMTLSSFGVYGILSYMALWRKARLAAGMYILTILCTLGMAGLAGGEQSVTRQWIEEGINTLAQVAFALGSYLLYSRFVTVWESERLE